MDIQFVTEDNVTLKGQVVEAENAKGAVIINPGTATKTSFYLSFAQFLAANGYHAVLWNYRGFCENRGGSLARSDISYTDLGRWDIPAVINKTKALYPQLPVYCVGHSAGGQHVGFAANCNELSGMVGVAVSTGYFGTMPLAYRLRAHLFFKAITPVSNALFGYVRAKDLNLMEDLPPKLAREWARWCTNEDFFFAPKFARKDPFLRTYRTLEFPVHVYTASDDEISTEDNTKNFWKHISTKEPVKFTRYNAADMPRKSVGHFGYFRSANEPIWQDILASLNSFNERAA